MLILFFHIAALGESAQNVPDTGNSGYMAGIIIAILILGYLIYSLFKPEKF